jgi:hypothetical protein
MVVQSGNLKSLLLPWLTLFLFRLRYSNCRSSRKFVARSIGVCKETAEAGKRSTQVLRMMRIKKQVFGVENED